MHTGVPRGLGSTCNSPTLPDVDLDFHLLNKHPSDKDTPSLPSTRRARPGGVPGIMRGGATTAGWACSSLSRPWSMQGTSRVGDGAVRKEEAGDGQDWGVESSYHCRKLPTGSKGSPFLHFFDWQASKSQGFRKKHRTLRSTAIIHVIEGAGQEPRWRLLTPAQALWTNAVKRLQADLGFRHSFHIKPRPRRHLVSLVYPRMQQGKKCQPCIGQ